MHAFVFGLALGEYKNNMQYNFYKQDCEKKQQKKIIFFLIFFKMLYSFLIQ